MKVTFVLDHFFLKQKCSYIFGKMISKQGNKPDLGNL